MKKSDNKKLKELDEKHYKILFYLCIVIFFIIILFPAMSILTKCCIFIWFIFSLLLVGCDIKSIKTFNVILIVVALLFQIFNNGYNDTILRYKMIRNCYEADTLEFINLKELNEKNVTYNYHVLLGKKVMFITYKNNNLYINGRSFGKNPISITKLNDTKMLVECKSDNKIKAYVIDISGFVVDSLKYDKVPEEFLNKYKK